MSDPEDLGEVGSDLAADGADRLPSDDVSSIEEPTGRERHPKTWFNMSHGEGWHRASEDEIARQFDPGNS